MGRSRIFIQAFLIPTAGADGIECPSGKRIGIHVSSYRGACDDQISEKPVCPTRQDRACSKWAATRTSPATNVVGRARRVDTENGISIKGEQGIS